MVQALRGGGAGGSVGSSRAGPPEVLGCDAVGIGVMGARGCCFGSAVVEVRRWRRQDESLSAIESDIVIITGRFGEH